MVENVNTGSITLKSLYYLAAAAGILFLTNMGFICWQDQIPNHNCLLGCGGLLLIDAAVIATVTAILQRKWLRPAVRAMSECEQEVSRIHSLLKRSHSSVPAETTMAQLKQISENLLESRQQERMIFEKAVDVICVIGVEGSILSVSPSVERAWGYKVEELIGRKLNEYILQSDALKSLEAALGAPYSIDRIAFDNQLRHKNGTTIDLSWSAHWSAKDDGLFCVAHDITERKKIESKVIESEKRLRSTLEAMPVGVVALHQSRYIEFANDSFVKLTGKPDSELLGRPIEELIPAEVRASMGSYLRDHGSAKETTVPLETSILTRNGSSIPVEISVSDLVVQSKPKLLVTFVDITQRKEIDRWRREFISMINHDLRAPLNSLSALLKLIESGRHGELTDKGKQLCLLADHELDRLLRLVGELLDFEKIETGKLIVHPQQVAVLDLIESSVSSVKSYADVRDIQIVYPETESACLADRTRIIQVLVNLLSNAIKFSPRESVIEISIEDKAEYLKFMIADCGRGISADKASLLFQRFQQLRPDDAAERSGSGLGLSICKAIVEAHDGEIGYLSKEEDAGSIFWFTLKTHPQHSD